MQSFLSVISANKPNLTFDISLSLHRKHKCFPSKVWCKQALVWAELKLNFSTTIKALLFKKKYSQKKVRICLLKKLVKFVTPKFVEAKARRLLTRMSLCIQTPLPLSLFRQPYYTQIPKPLLCVAPNRRKPHFRRIHFQDLYKNSYHQGIACYQ